MPGLLQGPLRVVLLLLVLTLVLAGPDARPLVAQGPASLVWEPRDRAPAAAFAIHLPGGALSDPAGQEGTAFLFGRVLEAEATSLLAPLSGRALVEVSRESIVVTVQVAAGEFETAWQEVSGLLTGGAFSEAAVQRARSRLVDEILFQAGAPVRAFELEWERGLRAALGTGGGDRADMAPLWGTVQGLSQATPASLQAWRNRSLPWSQATVGVVGSVSEASLRVVGARQTAAVRPAAEAGTDADAGADATPAPAAAPDPQPGADPSASPEDPSQAPPPLPPAPLRLGEPAPRLALAPGGARQLWTSPERRVVDQEVTSTWIGVAWALPRGTPWALRDFLAHVVSEALNPVPPDPGLYRASVQLERTGGTPLLVVIASVDPQAALAWEARILGALDRVAAEPPAGAFFDLARRRYRSTRLLAATDPALQARWLATQMADEGRVSHTLSESWGLTRNGLADLAEARGAPRILLYGPARMMTPP